MFTLFLQVKEMRAARRPADASAAGKRHDPPGADPELQPTAALDRLPQGARGTVRSIGGASTPLRQRLMELGITIGSEVKVIRKAPFGGPIEISVRGYRLSLRRTEARLVTVDRLG